MTNQTPEAGRGDEQSSETTDEWRLRELRSAVRVLPEPDRGPVTWDTVRNLDEAGMYALARIAEKYARTNERRSNRWWRRLGRWLFSTQTSHQTRPQDPEVGANQDSELEVEQ